MYSIYQYGIIFFRCSTSYAWNQVIFPAYSENKSRLFKCSIEKTNQISLKGTAEGLFMGFGHSYTSQN